MLLLQAMGYDRDGVTHRGPGTPSGRHVGQQPHDLVFSPGTVGGRVSAGQQAAVPLALVQTPRTGDGDLRSNGRREEVELTRPSVVPYEVEDPGATGDALPVTDPPDAVLAPGGRCRVKGIERCGGDR